MKFIKKIMIFIIKAEKKFLMINFIEIFKSLYFFFTFPKNLLLKKIKNI